MPYKLMNDGKSWLVNFVGMNVSWYPLPFTSEASKEYVKAQFEKGRPGAYEEK